MPLPQRKYCSRGGIFRGTTLYLYLLIRKRKDVAKVSRNIKAPIIHYGDRGEIRGTTLTLYSQFLHP